MVIFLKWKKKQTPKSPTHAFFYFFLYNNSLFLTRLEQQDGNLSQIEVDKVFGLVCDVAAKVAANNAMPCWVVLFVEFLFNVGGNVLLNVVLFECLRWAVDSVLLHVLGHVGVLNNSFAFGHFSVKKRKIKNWRLLVFRGYNQKYVKLPLFFYFFENFVFSSCCEC